MIYHYLCSVHNHYISHSPVYNSPNHPVPELQVVVITDKEDMGYIPIGEPLQ
jgi:hypothetical protein